MQQKKNHGGKGKTGGRVSTRSAPQSPAKRVTRASTRSTARTSEVSADVPTKRTTRSTTRSVSPASESVGSRANNRGDGPTATRSANRRSVTDEGKDTTRSPVGTDGSMDARTGRSDDSTNRSDNDVSNARPSSDNDISNNRSSSDNDISNNRSSSDNDISNNRSSSSGDGSGGYSSSSSDAGSYARSDNQTPIDGQARSDGGSSIDINARGNGQSYVGRGGDGYVGTDLRADGQTSLRGDNRVDGPSQRKGDGQATRPRDVRSYSREEAHDGRCACEVMTRNPRTARPTDSIQQVAQIMVEADTGVVPVVEDGKVRGMVTDRDIVCRMVAHGGDLRSSRVRDVMSTEVQCVRERDTVSDVMRVMRHRQIRRVPVIDDGGSLVGIISMADLAREASDDGSPVVKEKLQDTLREVSTEYGV